MKKIILFLRSLLFYVGYCLITLVIALSFLILFWLLPDSKRHLFGVLWCAIVLRWSRLACGIRYQVHGMKNIPDEPVVVLANHQSEWETLFIYRYLAPVSPILKKELLAIPVYGWAMRLVNPIAIDRSRRHNAGKSILYQGQQRLNGNRSVMIFPEGTRAKAGKVDKFSRGGAKLALASRASILPIAHNAGNCWPARHFLKYPGKIEVHIGAPIQTDNREASELTAEVEAWIRQHVVS
jgi:1-acyl-sn-glycerol-3-phosphate acyltransferase